MSFSLAGWQRLSPSPAGHPPGPSRGSRRRCRRRPGHFPAATAPLIVPTLGRAGGLAQTPRRPPAMVRVPGHDPALISASRPTTTVMLRFSLTLVLTMVFLASSVVHAFQFCSDSAKTLFHHISRQALCLKQASASLKEARSIISRTQDNIVKVST